MYISIHAYIHHPSQCSLNGMKCATGYSLKHYSFLMRSNNTELSKFWSAALGDFSIHSPKDPTWAQIAGWFVMGEMCEGWVPSKCYNSNWAQRVAEARKKKEKGKKQEMSEKQLACGRSACRTVVCKKHLSERRFIYPRKLLTPNHNHLRSSDVTFDCGIHLSVSL